jgi:hypothetical protein
MRCRRICRELLWLARFGEFGPSSQPHLDHLASCRGCRDAVGFDRAMVEQLRTALAQRIQAAEPSPSAWAGILARASTPEPAPAARLWEWSTAFLGRLRWATAMAGTGLALVLALNMEVVPIGVATSDAAPVTERTSLPQVPRMLAGTSLTQLASGGDATAGALRPDLNDALTIPSRPGPIRSDPETGSAEPLEQLPGTEVRLVFRALQTPDPGSAAPGVAIDTEDDRPELVDSEPGRPS